MAAYPARRAVIRFARATSPESDCPSQLYNDESKSPCAVAQELLQPCKESLIDVLGGPGANSQCTCNTVMYNLASACMDCNNYEEMSRLLPFDHWSTNCSAPNGLVLVYNNYSVPGIGTHVPAWAYGNLTSNHTFSLAAAVRNSNTSSTSGGWSSIQILTPIIVGLSLLISFASLLLYRRHRANGGTPLLMLLSTCCGRPRLVKPRRRHLGNEFDIDILTPSVPLHQRSPSPPVLATSSRSSARSDFRPRPIRTFPRRVGTFLQGVQGFFGRPIEVLPWPRGVMPDIDSDDEGEAQELAGAHSRQGSRVSIDLSASPPPVPPKDGANFWTRIKLPARFGGSSTRGSRYDEVNNDEGETVIIYDGGAESERGGASGSQLNRGRGGGSVLTPGTGASLGAHTGTRNDQTALPSGGQAVGSLASSSLGSLVGRQPIASGSNLSLSNLAEVAKASLSRQATAASKRRPKGSRLGKRKSALSDRGAPYGRSRTSLAQEEEEDPEEPRTLEDAVVESSPSEFFGPPTGFTVITNSPTESSGVGTGESVLVLSGGGRNISLTNSQESSAVARGAVSRYTSRAGSSRTGSSRTGTTNTFSSRDRRSLEVYPPTSAELDGRRFSVFTASSTRRSLPPSTLLPPAIGPLPTQLQVARGQELRRQGRLGPRVQPPSAFLSSNFSLAPPPSRRSERSEPHSPLSRSPTPPESSPVAPTTPPEPSSIAPTNETYHTAADNLSPSPSSLVNNGLLTPNTTPAPPGPRPLPQPAFQPSPDELSTLPSLPSSSVWATITPHANPDAVPLPPPLPLPPQIATLPPDSASTLTTSTGTTSSFMDESVLEILAPPNSGATGRSGESTSPQLANPYSPPASRTHSRAPSRSPLVPSRSPLVPSNLLPPSHTYSPPSSASKASFFTTPSHRSSPSASEPRPSLHSHSRSSDFGSRTSLYVQNASGSYTRTSLHTHSASTSRIPHHSPSASHSSLQSPPLSYRSLPQSPPPSARSLPSPAISMASLHSPPAAQTSFHPPAGSAPASSSSSYFPTLPRGTSPALAPSDPRNLVPPYIRGTGYDPYDPSADGRWNAVIEED